MALGDITQMLRTHTDGRTETWTLQHLYYPSWEAQTMLNELQNAFYTLDLSWNSNDEILSYIQAVFSSRVDREHAMQGLRQDITRVDLRPSAHCMAKLARTLASCIVSSIPADPHPTLIHIRHGLSEDALLDEIERVAKDPQGTLTLGHSHYASTLNQLHRTCELFDLVPADASMVGPFEQVLKVLAMAATSSTLAPAHVKQEEIRLRNEKTAQRNDQVQRYLLYIQTAKKDEMWRSFVRAALLKLPAEMRAHTLDELVQNMLPPHLKRLTEVDLKSLIKAILHTLADVGNREYNRPNHHLMEARLHPFDTESVEFVTESFGYEVEKAVLETLPLYHKAQFPTKSMPDRSPIPALLAQSNIVAIKELHLGLTIPHFTSSYYPSPIFNIQDNIADLKTWTPHLKSFRLEITDNSKPELSDQWMVRLPQRGFTTVEAELTLIVANMRRLDVREKAVRYQAADFSSCHALSPKSSFNLREMADEDVAQVLVTGMGDLLEI